MLPKFRPTTVTDEPADITEFKNPYDETGPSKEKYD